MNRGVLALLTRSLTIRGRSATTYISRFLLVLFLFIVMFSVQKDAEANRYSAPGLELFRSLTLINIGFIALYTMAFFTSTISEEKEEGTLGLLRMTKLSPIAIILGKSGARMSDVMLLLATQLPFTLLAITLGGISFEQIIASYISLAALLFFAFNVAVCFSVLCARTRSASGLTFLFFLTFLVSPYLIEALIRTFPLIDSTSSLFSMIIYLCDQSKKWIIHISIMKILSTDYDGSFLNPQVIYNFLFGLVFFLVGVRCFSFFNSGQPVKAAQRSVLLTRRSILTNERRRVWSSPLLWKEFFFLSGGPPIFIAKIVGYSILTLMIIGALAYQNLKITNAGIPLVIIFSVIGFIEVGLLAGRIFREELKWQTWATLTLLPRSMNQLFYRKILGATLSLAPVLLFMFFSALLNLDETLKIMKDKESRWVVFTLFGQTVLFAHGVLIIPLYMRQGAFALSFGLVLVTNMILAVLMERINRMDGIELPFEEAMTMLFAINISLSLIFHVRSRLRLHTLSSVG